MSERKTINLILEDNLNGTIYCSSENYIIACKISNYNFKNNNIYKDDFKQSGIYFLFGKNKENNKETIYIGKTSEADNGLIGRIKTPHGKEEIDNWTEAIMFARPIPFDEADVSYLEKELWKLATNSNKYELTYSP